MPDAVRAHTLERRLADVVRLLGLDQPLHAGDLEGIVLDCHVGVVVEDPRLDAARLARGDRADLVPLAGCHDLVPQFAAAGRILQEDLIAHLARPARPAHHDRDPVERDLGAEVVAQARKRLSEQVPYERGRLRSLDLQRIDRRLADGDVHSRAERHAARPQSGVAVSQAKPETIRGDAEQDGVVDDPALRAEQRRVLALAHGAPGQVAAGQHVGERERVRPGDLYHALDPYVPERHVL